MQTKTYTPENSPDPLGHALAFAKHARHENNMARRVFPQTRRSHIRVAFLGFGIFQVQRVSP